MFARRTTMTQVQQPSIQKHIYMIIYQHNTTAIILPTELTAIALTVLNATVYQVLYKGIHISNSKKLPVILLHRINQIKYKIQLRENYYTHTPV